MQGPVYRQSSAGPEKLEGFWSDGPDSDPDADVEFEVRFHTSRPERRYYGWQGFQRLDTTARSSTLPHGWKPLRSFTGTASRPDAGALYANPRDFPLLELWEFLKEDNRIFCDARGMTEDELLFYHTLPFFGWIQDINLEPPAYEPRRTPWARSGQEPLFCLVHGFTGDPENWIHLVDEISSTRSAYCVPLLPGHSLQPDGFERFGKTEWIQSQKVLLDRLDEDHESKIGIGLSMGGALILRYWEKFDALVLINTPVDVPSWRRFFLPFVNFFKQNHHPADSSKVFPISSLRQMGDLLRESSALLEEVNVPVLICSHEDDETVPQGHARYLRSMLPDATHVTFETGGHESPTNPQVAQTIFEEIVDWIRAEELKLSIPFNDSKK